MANWGGVQQGLVSGYQIGRSTGGGRLGALGANIKMVADRLREEEVKNQDFGQKVLGTVAINTLSKQLDPELAANQQLLQSEEGKGLRLKRLKVGDQTYEVPKEPGMTLAGAVSILSDPMKSHQLKTQYPQIFAEAENIVKANMGENILAKPSIDKKRKLKASFNEDETDVMDTNW